VQSLGKDGYDNDACNPDENNDDNNNNNNIVEMVDEFNRESCCFSARAMSRRESLREFWCDQKIYEDVVEGVSLEWKLSVGG
jgi:hypothetical protein